MKFPTSIDFDLFSTFSTMKYIINNLNQADAPSLLLHSNLRDVSMRLNPSHPAHHYECSFLFVLHDYQVGDHSALLTMANL